MSGFFEEKLDLSISMCFLFILICLGLSIYAIVMVTKVKNNLDSSILEVKSKIGAIIREVNNINRLEYQVNASQDQKINRMGPHS